MKKPLALLTIIGCLVGGLWLMQGAGYRYDAPDRGSVSVTSRIADAFNLSSARDWAAAFFAQGKTEEDIRGKYQNAKRMGKKLKVLIMPGHEPNFGGTEYKDLKERDLTVELSQNLAKLFNDNGRYEVIVPRDKDGWQQDFAEYFSANLDAIKAFAQSQREEMAQLVKEGSVKKLADPVYHNTASSQVAYRLYGINKWANENDVDIAIHVHFNDYPRKNSRRAGEYNGFAIYVPEKQYSNSASAKAIANSIFTRLSKYYPVSNLPKESDGIVEEQELIAIGSHNSVDAASMLIEYAYIYEPFLATKEVRDEALRDLAFATYLGVQDFVGSGNDVTLTYDVLSLPYEWKGSFGKGDNASTDIFALQNALAFEGIYPPAGRSKNDCPITGTFGPCTEAALKDFQRRFGIDQTGFVGEKTLNALNEEFGLQPI